MTWVLRRRLSLGEMVPNLLLEKTQSFHRGLRTCLAIEVYNTKTLLHTTDDWDEESSSIIEKED